MSVFLQPGFWVFVLALAGIYGIFSLGLQIQYGVGGGNEFWPCRNDGDIGIYDCGIGD